MNIDELIERLQKIASWMDQCAQQYEDISYHHQAEDINDAITTLRELSEQLEDLQKTVERAEPCLRELQSDARYYSAKAEAALEENKNLYERIAELEDRETYLLEMIEEFDHFTLVKQRDAAREALEELAKSPTPAGQYWKDFASDALRRIREMK